MKTPRLSRITKSQRVTYQTNRALPDHNRSRISRLVPCSSRKVYAVDTISRLIGCLQSGQPNEHIPVALFPFDSKQQRSYGEVCFGQSDAVVIIATLYP